MRWPSTKMSTKKKAQVQHGGRRRRTLAIQVGERRPAWGWLSTWKSTINKVRCRDHNVLNPGLFAWLYYRVIGFDERKRWRTQGRRCVRRQQVQQKTLAVDDKLPQKKDQQDTLAVTTSIERPAPMLAMNEGQHGGWPLMTRH